MRFFTTKISSVKKSECIYLHKIEAISLAMKELFYEFLANTFGKVFHGEIIICGKEKHQMLIITAICCFYYNKKRPSQKLTGAAESA